MCTIIYEFQAYSQTLQKPEMSSVEGHEIAMLTVKTLQNMQSDRDFNEISRIQYDIDEPTLPRKRKRPNRYEDGDSEAEFPAAPKYLYRRKYFDLA